MNGERSSPCPLKSPSFSKLHVQLESVWTSLSDIFQEVFSRNQFDYETWSSVGPELRALTEAWGAHQQAMRTHGECKSCGTHELTLLIPTSDAATAVRRMASIRIRVAFIYVALQLRILHPTVASESKSAAPRASLASLKHVLPTVFAARNGTGSTDGPIQTLVYLLAGLDAVCGCAQEFLVSNAFSGNSTLLRNGAGQTTPRQWRGAVLYLASAARILFHAYIYGLQLWSMHFSSRGRSALHDVHRRLFAAAGKTPGLSADQCARAMRWLNSLPDTVQSRAALARLLRNDVRTMWSRAKTGALGVSPGSSNEVQTECSSPQVCSMPGFCCAFCTACMTKSKGAFVGFAQLDRFAVVGDLCSLCDELEGYVEPAVHLVVDDDESEPSPRSRQKDLVKDSHAATMLMAMWHVQENSVFAGYDFAGTVRSWERLPFTAKVVASGVHLCYDLGNESTCCEGFAQPLLFDSIVPICSNDKCGTCSAVDCTRDKSSPTRVTPSACPLTFVADLFTSLIGRKVRRYTILQLFWWISWEHAVCFGRLKGSDEFSVFRTVLQLLRALRCVMLHSLGSPKHLGGKSNGSWLSAWSDWVSKPAGTVHSCKCSEESSQSQRETCFYCSFPFYGSELNSWSDDSLQEILSGPLLQGFQVPGMGKQRGLGGWQTVLRSLGIEAPPDNAREDSGALPTDVKPEDRADAKTDDHPSSEPSGSSRRLSQQWLVDFAGWVALWPIVGTVESLRVSASARSTLQLTGCSSVVRQVLLDVFRVLGLEREWVTPQIWHEYLSEYRLLWLRQWGIVENTCSNRTFMKALRAQKGVFRCLCCGNTANLQYESTVTDSELLLKFDRWVQAACGGCNSSQGSLLFFGFVHRFVSPMISPLLLSWTMFLPWYMSPSNVSGKLSVDVVYGGKVLSTLNNVSVDFFDIQEAVWKQMVAVSAANNAEGCSVFAHFLLARVLFASSYVQNGFSATKEPRGVQTPLSIEVVSDDEKQRSCCSSLTARPVGAFYVPLLSTLLSAYSEAWRKLPLYNNFATKSAATWNADSLTSIVVYLLRLCSSMRYYGSEDESGAPAKPKQSWEGFLAEPAMNHLMQGVQLRLGDTKGKSRRRGMAVAHAFSRLLSASTKAIKAKPKSGGGSDDPAAMADLVGGMMGGENDGIQDGVLWFAGDAKPTAPESKSTKVVLDDRRQFRVADLLWSSAKYLCSCSGGEADLDTLCSEGTVSGSKCLSTCAYCHLCRRASGLVPVAWKVLHKHFVYCRRLHQRTPFGYWHQWVDALEKRHIGLVAVGSEKTKENPKVIPAAVEKHAPRTPVEASLEKQRIAMVQKAKKLAVMIKGTVPTPPLYLTDALDFIINWRRRIQKSAPVIKGYLRPPTAERLLLSTLLALPRMIRRVPAELSEVAPRLCTALVGLELPPSLHGSAKDPGSIAQILSELAPFWWQAHDAAVAPPSPRLRAAGDRARAAGLALLPSYMPPRALTLGTLRMQALVTLCSVMPRAVVPVLVALVYSTESLLAVKMQALQVLCLSADELAGYRLQEMVRDAFLHDILRKQTKNSESSPSSPPQEAPMKESSVRYAWKQESKSGTASMLSKQDMRHLSPSSVTQISVVEPADEEQKPTEPVKDAAMISSPRIHRQRRADAVGTNVEFVNQFVARCPIFFDHLYHYLSCKGGLVDQVLGKAVRLRDLGLGGGPSRPNPLIEELDDGRVDSESHKQWESMLSQTSAMSAVSVMCKIITTLTLYMRSIALSDLTQVLAQCHLLLSLLWRLRDHPHFLVQQTVILALYDLTVAATCPTRGGSWRTGRFKLQRHSVIANAQANSSKDSMDQYKSLFNANRSGKFWGGKCGALLDKFVDWLIERHMRAIKARKPKQLGDISAGAESSEQTRTLGVLSRITLLELYGSLHVCMGSTSSQSGGSEGLQAMLAALDETEEDNNPLRHRSQRDYKKFVGESVMAGIRKISAVTFE